MQNRINKVFCVFDNPIVEERLLKKEWEKINPYFSTICILGSIIPLTAVISGIYNGFYTNLIVDGTYTLMGLIGLIVKDSDLRRKLVPIFIVLAFCIILPANIFYNFDPKMETWVTLPLQPIITILILLRLVPLSFSLALISSFISFISLIAIQDHQNMMYAEYVSFIIPYLILAFDKRRSELNKRIEFSQKETIQSTKKLMHKTLNRYFGETLSNKILSEEGNLKGEVKWVSVSFTDISSYSTIIENMSPEVAVKILNEYFTKMHDVIEAHGGQILNYIGDAIMVVFGAPNSLEDHEVKAVECAIEMRNSLELLNQTWDEKESSRYWKNHGIEKITVRTGIHTGSVIAGNIGSERMLQYSAIGDVVNVAARLEQANKDFKTDICISEEIYINLTKKLHGEAKFSGDLKLKGRSAPSKVYTI